MIKKTSISIIILLFAYLLFFPVKLKPVVWESQDIPELVGDFAVNEQLNDIEILFSGECPQCEDVDVDKQGNVYGAAYDGRVIKFISGQASNFAVTNGRPLGIHFDTLENLIVCDAYKGLLLVNPSGQITELTNTHNDLPFLFTDDAEISKDGIVYFSDASHKYNVHDYKFDIIEHTANGRLLSYNLATKETNLLLDNLYFANGVALNDNEDFVLVNETSAHRITRFWLKGEKRGTSDTFLDNLPFYPDGISNGENGIFWIAMQSPRKKILEVLSEKPFIRKIFVRVPPALMPKPVNYSFVLGVDENGTIKYNLQDPDGGFAQITSIQQVGNKLYLGSLYEDGIGVYNLD